MYYKINKYNIYFFFSNQGKSGCLHYTDGRKRNKYCLSFLDKKSSNEKKKKKTVGFVGNRGLTYSTEQIRKYLGFFFFRTYELESNLCQFFSSCLLTCCLN